MEHNNRQELNINKNSVSMCTACNSKSITERNNVVTVDKHTLLTFTALGSMYVRCIWNECIVVVVIYWQVILKDMNEAKDLVDPD
jgi:hypothetical protein